MNVANIVSTFSKMSNLYSPAKLTDKITNVAKKAGIKVIYAALLLYYTLMAGDVPTKDKAIVLGTLGYFICPADMIPDMLPGALLTMAPR